MPNPFSSKRTARTNDYAVPPDSYPPEDIPHPVRPLIETGPRNFSYRGSETHGVDTDIVRGDAHAEIFDQGEVPPDHQKPPERHEVPVPVHIVNTGDQELRAFGTGQSVAPANASPLISRDQSRTKLTIRNLSATIGVWIGTDRSCSPMTGHYIPPGAEESINTIRSVYAMSADGSNVPVSLLWEYVVEA